MPLFIRDSNTGKVIRTYEKGMYTVYGTYFHSAARFNAIAKTIPEYLHTDFYKLKGDNNLRNAMNSLGGTVTWDSFLLAQKGA